MADGDAIESTPMSGTPTGEPYDDDNPIRAEDEIPVLIHNIAPASSHEDVLSEIERLFEDCVGITVDGLELGPGKGELTHILVIT